MCCPFCTCIYILSAHTIFIFKTSDFFGRNALDGQILQCSHDEGRLLLGEHWSTCTSLLIQRCERRCSTSSRLSFFFGSLLKNSDVHEGGLGSCLQHRRRESIPSTMCKTARRECVHQPQNLEDRTLQCIQKYFSQILFDFKRMVSHSISPKFSGEIPYVLSKPRICFLGSKDKTVLF